MSEQAGTGLTDDEALVEAAEKAHYAAWSLNTAEREGWDDSTAHNRGMTLAVLRVVEQLRAASTPPAEPAPTGAVAGECLDCYGDEGICDKCPAGEGCDCTDLCSMGPTCPGGMLAGLAGSGCWRAAEPAATGAVEALAAPAKEPLRAHAYYYGFDLTGVGIVDRILSEVCAAGKGHHHTEMWGEEGWDGGPSYVDRIQKAADDAAAAIRAAVAASQPTATHHDEGLRTRIEAIPTHNDTPVTAENLRWAATHEALCRSWIFDVLTGLAEVLADTATPTQPHDNGAGGVA